MQKNYRASGPWEALRPPLLFYGAQEESQNYRAGQARRIYDTGGMIRLLGGMMAATGRPIKTILVPKLTLGTGL